MRKALLAAAFLAAVPLHAQAVTVAFSARVNLSLTECLNEFCAGASLPTTVVGTIGGTLEIDDPLTDQFISVNTVDASGPVRLVDFTYSGPFESFVLPLETSTVFGADLSTDFQFARVSGFWRAPGAAGETAIFDITGYQVDIDIESTGFVSQYSLLLQDDRWIRMMRTPLALQRISAAPVLDPGFDTPLSAQTSFVAAAPIPVPASAGLLLGAFALWRGVQRRLA